MGKRICLKFSEEGSGDGVTCENSGWKR